MSDQHSIPAPSKTEVDDFLSREEFRRQSNKVLHGHPSPMYWKPLSSPTSLLLEERAEYSRNTQFDVNLYVGTPFCIKTKPAVAATSINQPAMGTGPAA